MRGPALLALVAVAASVAVLACAESPPASPASPTPASSRESSRPSQDPPPNRPEPRAFKSCTERLYAEYFDRDGGAATDAGEARRAEPRDAGGDATVPISDADLVIASLRPQFRRCYQKGLGKDHLLQGCVVMWVRVSPDGTVATAKVGAGEGLTEEVNACLLFEVSHAKFSPPGGGGAILHVPVTFIQASK